MAGWRTCSEPAEFNPDAHLPTPLRAERRLGSPQHTAATVPSVGTHTHTRHKRPQGPELLLENSALFRQRTKASYRDFLELEGHQCDNTLK